jgi:hypothetical protein
MLTRLPALTGSSHPARSRRTGRAARLAALACLGALSFGPGALAQKPKAATEKAAPAAAAAAPTEKGTTEKAAPGGAAAPASVVATEEGKEGVKTYKFGAVEVEGRLKSPQLIYFLRRVRAEFAAGDLGHRSFLRELSETQRQPSFR